MGTIKLTGMKELQGAFIRAADMAPRLAAKAMYEEASEAFLLSQAVVPVRYGVLRASGVVHPPTILNSIAIVDITYGGPGAPYALFVHEIPPSKGGRWGSGAKHDSPTRWKYLENPVKLHARDMGRRLTVRVLDMLNRGF